MIKRISLLIAAALMAVMMMVATAAPAFADPCEKNPDHKHCKTTNPGGQENSPSCEEGRNPNCTTDFDNPSDKN